MRKHDDISLGILPVRSEESSDISALVRQIGIDLEYHLELARLRARVNRTFYDELCREGFSKDQALEIIKAKGV